MGYSIRTASYRYTRWMPWRGNHSVGALVDWDAAVGEELYDHAADSGLSYMESEVDNLAGSSGHADVRASLEAALKAGWGAARPTAKRSNA